MSNEQKAKISAALKQHTKTPEHRAALSKSLNGNQNHTQPHTEEARAKMRQAWEKRKVKG